MYITYDQLIQMMLSLEAMKRSTPRWNLVQRFRLNCMISTVVGEITWIEDRMKQESEEKCKGCGQFHSDLGPYPGNN
jgi:hypothetical protein